MPTFAFSDFDQVIDRFHALCDVWAEGGPYVDLLGQDGLHVLRLTVHEWIANLLQHAAFPGEREILFSIWTDGDAVRCAVEDTSAGFDFATQISQQKAILDAPAPSERGRGLLMLVTCAEELEYRPTGAATRQRIAFALRDPAGGDLAMLFRAADLGEHPDDSFSGDGQASGAVSLPPVPASAEDRR